MVHGKSALEYLTWGGVLHKLSCNISRSDHGVLCAPSFFFLGTDLLKSFKTRRWKNCKQFQKWVDWTPMWTLKLSLRRFFLTALLGFITIQNYIKNLLKMKERRKKTFIPKGASTNGTKEPMGGAARESSSRKNKSLKSPKYTNMSSIKREY